MAILNSILRGQLKGTIGNQWFAHARTKNGKPVTKVGTINGSPINPRTSPQMEQRARFANAVKFYRHATQNFFKFAFEDKAKNESDYNAFMRHNIDKSMMIRKDLVQSPTFPAVGNEWLLSVGSLSFGLQLSRGYLGSLYLFTAPLVGDTIAKVSLYLVNNYGLKLGDIVTLVFVSTSYNGLDSSAEETPTAPKWQVLQFVVNFGDNTSILDMQSIGAKLVSLSPGSEEEGTLLTINAVAAYPQTWGSIIVTRKKNGGLYATTSYLVPSYYARELVKVLDLRTNINDAVDSWTASDSAILEGSVAANSDNVAVSEDYSGVVVTSVNGYAKEGSDKNAAVFGTTLQGNDFPCSVDGSNLVNVRPESSDISVATVGTFNFESASHIEFTVVPGKVVGTCTITYAGWKLITIYNPSESSGTSESSSNTSVSDDSGATTTKDGDGKGTEQSGGDNTND